MGIGESVTLGVDTRYLEGGFEGKYIGIPMGIGESVTLGVVNTLSVVVNLGTIYRNTYGNRGIGNLWERITVSDGGQLGKNL